MNPAAMNFAAVSAAVLACVCEALESAGTPACVCEETLGAPALVSCDCQCDGPGMGQVGLWTDSTFLSSSFPNEMTQQTLQETACGVPLIVASMNVQISRCTSADAAFGQYTPVQLQHRDSTVVRQAVACCLADMLSDKTIKRFIMGTSTFNPEQGGCAGSTLGFRVALGHCLCPPDPVT